MYILTLFLSGLIYLAKLGFFQIVCIIYVCKKIVNRGIIEDLMKWIEDEMTKSNDDNIDIIYIIEKQ